MSRFQVSRDAEMRDDVARLWATGHSMSQIGAELGVTKNVICGLVHRMRLPMRPSPIKRIAERMGAERRPTYAAKFTIPK
ncbi:MAG: GcrA family cell cycle regulator, partial [Acetobacteraceae bacterium]